MLVLFDVSHAGTRYVSPSDCSIMTLIGIGMDPYSLHLTEERGFLGRVGSRRGCV